jgi:hypothetical protein
MLKLIKWTELRDVERTWLKVGVVAPWSEPQPTLRPNLVAMVHRFIQFLPSCLLGAPMVRADRTICFTQQQLLIKNRAHETRFREKSRKSQTIQRSLRCHRLQRVEGGTEEDDVGRPPPNYFCSGHRWGDWWALDGLCSRQVLTTGRPSRMWTNCSGRARGRRRRGGCRPHGRGLGQAARRHIWRAASWRSDENTPRRHRMTTKTKQCEERRRHRWTSDVDRTAGPYGLNGSDPHTLRYFLG